MPHSRPFRLALPGLMHPLLPSLIAAGLYAGTTAYQGLRLAQRAVPDKRLLGLLGIVALLAHGTALYLQLITASGLNLDFFNAASLIAAAVILLTLLATLRIPVENLLLLLFPLGALTTLLSFGLLAVSRTPAIANFGLAVALGVGFSLLWAPWVQPRRGSGAGDAT